MHILPGAVQRQEEDEGFSKEGMVSWDPPDEGEVCLEEETCSHPWVGRTLCAGDG